MQWLLEQGLISVEVLGNNSLRVTMPLKFGSPVGIYSGMTKDQALKLYGDKFLSRNSYFRR